MNKLLNKPFKAFTLYALFILICSIPIYYLVVDNIWLEEIDEHNKSIKEKIEQKFNSDKIDTNELTKTIQIWNSLNVGSTIISSTPNSIKPDSIYTKLGKIYNDKLRTLSCYIQIKGKPYHLLIQTNTEETIRTLLAITVITSLFFCFLVIGFIYLNKKISLKIWGPFYSMLDKIKLFDLNNNQKLSFQNTDIEEFNVLNNELNKLINKNISVYNQQKTFIENASHELQTPLAVLKSKIDLLLQNKHLTNEQSEIINTISSSISRVSRINKNLLLLSKIENKQFSKNEPVNVVATFNENIEILADHIEDKGLSISVINESNPILSCNKMLLEILITNLLINSIRHNEINGKIIIEVKAQSISISNSGNVPLDSIAIFQRFVVSSSETTNSGLGLSIVKEICKRYNWQIEYSFSNQLHIFLVKF